MCLPGPRASSVPRWARTWMPTAAITPPPQLPGFPQSSRIPYAAGADTDVLDHLPLFSRPKAHVSFFSVPSDSRSARGAVVSRRSLCATSTGAQRAFLPNLFVHSAATSRTPPLPYTPTTVDCRLYSILVFCKPSRIGHGAPAPETKHHAIQCII